MIFTRVDKSNREDWLKWRQGGIGSSDAPVIMGVSRFKTIEQLLGEKTGTLAKYEANQYIKDRGNRIEPMVRELYEKQMGIQFPAVSVYNTENEHLIASLDGMDDNNNLIIEIKLMTTAAPGKRNTETAGYKKWLQAKDENIVPVDYYPQLQHQLMVTGLPACIFLGYRETRGIDIHENDIAIVSVLRDDSYIATLKYKSLVFWKEVVKIRGENNVENSNSTGA